MRLTRKTFRMIHMIIMWTIRVFDLFILFLMMNGMHVLLVGISNEFVRHYTALITAGFLWGMFVVKTFYDLDPAVRCWMIERLKTREY